MIFYKLANTLILTASETAEHGGEQAESALRMHIPNVLTFINESFAHHYEVSVFALLIALIMSVMAITVYRKRQMIPGPFQNVVEIIFEGLYNLVYAMLGKDTDRYIPFLGTLFIYIWFMNLSGVIPGFYAPTASLNMTVALAITVFIYVQVTALVRTGPIKYLHHLAGSPESGVTWALVIINFPLHFVGEFIKPFSLAMRLFGNIFGEDTLIAVMVSLGVVALSAFGSPIGLPFHIPFILLSMLLGTIQALVFTMLSTSYIMMVLPHEEH